MRDRRRRQLVILIFLGLTLLVFAACAVKHSDVMLFGTNTKYGLSIAIDQPENTPHINLGYKRQEFVWMPLFVNGADSVAGNNGGGPIQEAKYTGKEPVQKEDTYSVLASFGANFSASGTGAGGGIAQYFATGLAARNLASVGGASLVQASSINLTPKGTEFTKEQLEAVRRLVNPTEELILLKGQLAQLLKKKLKDGTQYMGKAYNVDAMRQYADAYVQAEVNGTLTAPQLYATGTEAQLKQLVEALSNVAAE